MVQGKYQKKTKCMCTIPFILHDAEEINHLIAQYTQMLRRCGSNLALDSAKTFLNQLFQGPSCTVAGQHGQVMNVNVCISVRLCDLIVMNLRKANLRLQHRSCLRSALRQNKLRWSFLLPASLQPLRNCLRFPCNRGLWISCYGSFLSACGKGYAFATSL